MNQQTIDPAVPSGLIQKVDDNFDDLYSGKSRPTITNLTGGTSADLDGITTAGVTVGAIQLVNLSGDVRLYALVSGTDAESSPDVIRPDDYATTTNEKVWKWICTTPTPLTSDNSTKAVNSAWGTAKVQAELALITSADVKFNYAALTSDHTFNGPPIVGQNGGEDIVFGQAVYWSFSDGEWMLADADGSGTFPAGGLAVTSSTNGNPITVLQRGFVRDDSWNWSAGPIYLGTTAGSLTQPPPTADNGQKVGFAVTADIAFFDFTQSYVTFS